MSFFSDLIGPGRESSPEGIKEARRNKFVGAFPKIDRVKTYDKLAFDELFFEGWAKYQYFVNEDGEIVLFCHTLPNANPDGLRRLVEYNTGIKAEDVITLFALTPTEADEVRVKAKGE